MQAGDILSERFELRREAGAGGMGSVWLADDRTTGEAVAIKVIDAEDPRLVERFVREAQILSELRHPGVVRYVAHGVTPAGRRWLAMEVLDGVVLGQRIARGGLPVATTLAMGHRIADALGAAHSRGIVHRDVKPGNLFLVGGRFDDARVLDFGIARIRHLSGLTVAGLAIGTPAYMSPEQARAIDEVDARSDVYSLGVVLFCCLTGRKPFTGADPVALIAKILLAEAPRVRDLRRDVPAAVDALIARMLSKSPEDRPSDGRAVVEEIARLRLETSEDRGEPPARVMGGSEQLVTCLALVASAAHDGVARRIVEVREALRAFGARAEPMADGSVVVVLSAPGAAATDLTNRGARCALRLRELLPDAPIALVTGRAVVSGTLPVGEVIDRAARLLRGEADPTLPRTPGRPSVTLVDGAILPPPRLGPGIRVDDVTAGLLDPRFDVGQDAHGLELRGERDAGAVRTLLGRPSPFVGRATELMSLEAQLAGALDGEARAVLVTGPPGVGKSRLRQELVARIVERGVPVWQARCDPMSAGAPLGVLAGVIRASKVLSRVAALPDGARIGAFLGEVAPHVGEAGARAPEDVQVMAARGDPQLFADQVRRAFLDWLDAETAAHPVVIVLDDVHWGDAPSLALLDAALARLADRPLLVVATARPEVADLFPRLWEERNTSTLRLGDLGKRAAEQLVRRVLVDATAETVARIVERAGGNAFFLEELVRARAAGVDLPGTVLAMVQARIEALEPAARRVLRAASVFGESFPEEGLRALLGEEDIAAWLRVLVEREVVVHRGEARLRGEPEYGFRHALVRDAAYATLTPDDARLAHGLAAAWLEATRDHDAVGVAEQYERSAAPRSAGTWWRRAAEQALRSNDLAAVLAHVARALRCGVSGEELGAARLLEAEAREWRGGFAEAEAAGLEAMRWLPRGDDRWYAAIGVVATSAGVRGQSGRLPELAAMLGDVEGAAGALAAARVAEQLVIHGLPDLAGALLARIAPLAEALRPTAPGVSGRIWAALALRERYHGDTEADLRLVERAIAAYEEAGDLRNATVRRERLGYARLELGDHAASERILGDALATAERLGLRNVAATARHNLGLVLSRLGRHEEARRVEAEAAAAFAESGNRRMEGASLEYLALILLAAGEAAAAERAAREALDVASAEPVLPLNQAESLSILARVLLSRGEPEAAFAAAEQGVRMLESLGGIDDGEAIIRLTWAETLHAVGRAAEALAAISAARDRLLRRAARFVDPASQRMFLEAVPENARTVALAEAWLAVSPRSAHPRSAR